MNSIYFYEYRDPSKERRERRYRQRSPDDSRESDRAVQKLHMDRDENSREHRRQRLNERLGQRPRQSDAREDNEDKEDRRWKERNQRYCKKIIIFLSIHLHVSTSPTITTYL